MKFLLHPSVAYTGIGVSAGTSFAGISPLETSGDPGMIIAGATLSTIMWILIIIDRGRKTQSFLPAEADNNPDCPRETHNLPG